MGMQISVVPNSLLMMLRAFRRPVLFGVAAASISIVWTLTVPNRYRSESKVLAADARSNGGGLSAAALAVGVSIPGQESADSAYVDILTSRWVSERILGTCYRFHLKSWYFGKDMIREQTFYTYLGAKNPDQAHRLFLRHVIVNRDMKTKLLSISAETTSPELSQKVVQDMVKLLEEFVISKARTRGWTKAEFASKRLAEAKMEMDLAERDLQAFVNVNRNATMSSDPLVRLKNLRLENDYKIKTQIVTTLSINREQSLLEEKNDMPILNLLEDGNLPYEKNYPPRSLIVVGVFISFTLMFLVYERKLSIRL